MLKCSYRALQQYKSSGVLPYALLGHKIYDLIALFENVEKEFDRLFNYNRQLSETFEYCNTMKNGTVGDKLQMQERELKAPTQNIAGEKKNKQTGIYAQISKKN